MSKLEILQVVNFSVSSVIELILFIVWRHPMPLVLSIAFGVFAIGLVIIFTYFARSEKK